MYSLSPKFQLTAIDNLEKQKPQLPLAKLNRIAALVPESRAQSPGFTTNPDDFIRKHNVSARGNLYGKNVGIISFEEIVSYRSAIPTIT